MDNAGKWKCSGNDYRRMPDSVIEMGVRAFVNLPDFSRALDILYPEKDCIIRLPLMDNLEAIAYGGVLSCISNMYTIKEYYYNKPEELTIKRGDLLKTEPIKCVLEYIRNNKDRKVMLDIEGPFTILAGLVCSETLFMYQRKKPEILENLLNTIADDLVLYAKAAIDAGVKLISFSDPQSSIDLVGQKAYERFSGQAIIRFLKRIEPYLEQSILHVCGKTSFGLLKTNMVKNVPMAQPETDYRESLFAVAENPDYRIVGNACINDVTKTRGFINCLIMNADKLQSSLCSEACSEEECECLLY